MIDFDGLLFYCEGFVLCVVDIEWCIVGIYLEYYVVIV